MEWANEKGVKQANEREIKQENDNRFKQIVIKYQDPA